MKRMLALSAAGLIAMLALGGTLIATGHGGIGWWFVLCGVAGTAITAVSVARGQRLVARVNSAHGDDGLPGRAPGRSADQSAGLDPTARPARWVGSASTPGALGYMDVSVPLAVAEVGPGRLVLRVRPAIFRLMFGLATLTVAPGDGVVIFPAHKFGQEGIEIRLNGRPSHYFWIGRRQELLASLAAAGFDVRAEEQQMRRR